MTIPLELDRGVDARQQAESVSLLPSARAIVHVTDRAA